MKEYLKSALVIMVLVIVAKASIAQITPSSTEGWRKLSLREKIGQTMIMLPDRELEMKLGNGSLEGLFKRYPVTGFFMGWKLFTGIANKDKVTHLRKSVMEYQKASAMPLIFQEDYEHGLIMEGMTSLPREMALGAANSPKLAYNYGKGLALEARSVGVQWVLHPMADLNINPLNPIVNNRGISDDPDKAIKLLNEQIKGLQDNGVAATIKHFPGDGVDFRDQHLTTTVNSLTMEEWRKYHGKVFQSLIDSGVAAIMPGHITLPAYQKEKLNGFFPPATLSSELLTNLLKKEMGFKGVIISDAMTMGGFRGWYPNQLEGELESFAAGVDVLLWPSYAFMDSLELRIKRGEVPMSRLDDAVSRIWAMKNRFDTLDPKRKLLREIPAKDNGFAQLTADEISEAAVTLVRDRNNTIPLRPEKTKKILIVALTPNSRKGGDGGFSKLKHFKELLKQTGFEVTLKKNILYEVQGWSESDSEKYDKVIFVSILQNHRPMGPLMYYDDEAESAWAANAMPKDKLIVVSFGSPYVMNQYFERVNTCINAYSNDPEMHSAVVRILTGELKARGVSPVNLKNNAFKNYKTIN